MTTIGLSILEQEDALKNLPTQALQEMLRRPTSQVPLFMVAAEVKRRFVIKEQLAGKEAATQTAQQAPTVVASLAGRQQPVPMSQAGAMATSPLQAPMPPGSQLALAMAGATEQPPPQLPTVNARTGTDGAAVAELVEALRREGVRTPSQMPENKPFSSRERPPPVSPRGLARLIAAIKELESEPKRAYAGLEIPRDTPSPKGRGGARAPARPVAMAADGTQGRTVYAQYGLTDPGVAASLRRSEESRAESERINRADAAFRRLLLQDEWARRMDGADISGLAGGVPLAVGGLPQVDSRPNEYYPTPISGQPEQYKEQAGSPRRSLEQIAAALRQPARRSQGFLPQYEGRGGVEEYPVGYRPGPQSAADRAVAAHLQSPEFRGAKREAALERLRLQKEWEERAPYNVPVQQTRTRLLEVPQIDMGALGRLPLAGSGITGNMWRNVALPPQSKEWPGAVYPEFPPALTPSPSKARVAGMEALGAPRVGRGGVEEYPVGYRPGLQSAADLAVARRLESPKFRGGREAALKELVATLDPRGRGAAPWVSEEQAGLPQAERPDPLFIPPALSSQEVPRLLGASNVGRSGAFKRLAGSGILEGDRPWQDPSAKRFLSEDEGRVKEVPAADPTALKVSEVAGVTEPELADDATRRARQLSYGPGALLPPGEKRSRALNVAANRPSGTYTSRAAIDRARQNAEVAFYRSFESRFLNDPNYPALLEQWNKDRTAFMREHGGSNWEQEFRKGASLAASDVTTAEDPSQVSTLTSGADARLSRSMSLADAARSGGWPPVEAPSERILAGPLAASNVSLTLASDGARPGGARPEGARLDGAGRVVPSPGGAVRGAPSGQIIDIRKVFNDSVKQLGEGTREAYENMDAKLKEVSQLNKADLAKFGKSFEALEEYYATGKLPERMRRGRVTDLLLEMSKGLLGNPDFYSAFKAGLEGFQAVDAKKRKEYAEGLSAMLTANQALLSTKVTMRNAELKERQALLTGRRAEILGNTQLATQHMELAARANEQVRTARYREQTLEVQRITANAALYNAQTTTLQKNINFLAKTDFERLSAAREDTKQYPLNDPRRQAVLQEFNENFYIGQDGRVFPKTSVYGAKALAMTKAPSYQEASARGRRIAEFDRLKIAFQDKVDREVQVLGATWDPKVNAVLWDKIAASAEPPIGKIKGFTDFDSKRVRLLQAAEEYFSRRLAGKRELSNPDMKKWLEEKYKPKVNRLGLNLPLNLNNLPPS